MESSKWAGDGEQTREVSERLSSIHNGSSVLLTTSCTAALEMCAVLLDLQPGDEVIVPSFTFVSTANAFVLMGATVVFAEIDSETLGISLTTVLPLVTARTKAVCLVNYAGTQAMSRDEIQHLQDRGIVVIEDNAHGLFATGSAGEPLGISSDLSTLSFHETKNVTCGEGGAVVINNGIFLERAEIIREKGTDRSRFFRGMIDKYTWRDRGSSYLASEFSAAVLNSQLDVAEQIQLRRKTIAHYYAEELRNLRLGEQNVRAIDSNISPKSSHHMFYLLMASEQERVSFINSLKSSGVTAAFHYVPLHDSPAGRKFGKSASNLPMTTRIANSLVRLPLFSDIKSSEAEQVVAAIKKYSESQDD